MSGLDAFNRLSPAAKVGVMAVAVGIPVALAAIFRGPAMWAVLGGVVLVGVALAAYSMVLARQERRRASPMFQALAASAAVTPMGITEPARRARLDDLRKNFESGVEKFRDAGKNVYALPWYAVVGEPGSGKTEAIRHCNVGFPPGLQDQLQGAGGTLNMNWWFTNHAVMLDTAGRLMFEEVEPGATGEWQEFLKLLRRYRPNCPINGMLLVIPSESLIRDASESIERKGGKIAQQLDSIQRALGVRFPVFVVVTKCDLINGFREFFDEISEPSLQHQMLGWSNPAPLDTPFDPALVEEHLKTVQQRLVRRRAGLLLDPINTDDPKARRTDQVDALYVFPESLVKIAPRLRRYLEMIFVAGEWSQKPLFLRGIYFTSAVREGAALDAELAQALGVPVESLPEGRIWQRDRAFFLRDLFMAKVFRERGLVTRAVSTSRLQRARRRVLLGTAGGGLLALGTLTWLGHRSMARSVVGPSDFWSKASEAYTRAGLREANRDLHSEEFYLPVVERSSASDESWRYRGGDEEPFKGVPAERALGSIAKFPKALRRAVTDRVEVPWVFRPIALQGNLLADERAAAARVLIEGSLLRPLINAAEVRLRREADDAAPWSPEATAALAQLLRLRVAGLPGSRAGPIEVDPLLQYAVKGNEEDAKKAKADAPDIQDAVRWFYSSESGGSWPPKSLVDSRRAELDEAIQTGVKRFVSAWGSVESAPVGSAEFAGMQSLLGALDEFAAKETELLGFRERAERREMKDAGVLEDFARQLSDLVQVGRRIDTGLEVLQGPGKADRSLSQAFKAELGAFRAQATRQHEMLLDELKPLSADGGADEALVAGRQGIEKSLSGVSKESPRATETAERVDRLDRQQLGSPEPAFRRRLKMYEWVGARLGKPPEPGPLVPGATRDALLSVERSAESDLKEVSSTPQAGPASDPAARDLEARARGLCTSMIGAASALRRTEFVSRFLEEVQGSGKGGEAGVKAAFEDRVRFRAADRVLADCFAVRRLLAPSGSTPPGVFGSTELGRRFAPIDHQASEHLHAFVEHLTLGSPRLSADDWPVFAASLRAPGDVRVITAFVEAVCTEAKSASAALTANLDRDALSAADRQEIERLTRASSRGMETLAGNAFKARCEGVFKFWSGLSADAGEARAKFLAASAGGRIRELVVGADAGSESAGADIAQRSLLGFSRTGVRALARVEGGATGKAVTHLKSLGFPLGPAGREMEPGELEPARRDCEVARAAVAGASAPDSSSSGDPQIDADIASMRKQDAVSADDARALDRLCRVLDAIGPGDLKCSVTVLPNEAATRGAGRINEYLPDLGLAKAGQEPERLVSIYDGGNQQIADLPTPSGPYEVRVYDRNQPDKKAVLPIPTRWGGLGLVAMPEAKRQGGGLSCKVELLMPYNGNNYSLWLRLDFSRPLPEGWPW